MWSQPCGRGSLRASSASRSGRPRRIESISAQSSTSSASRSFGVMRRSRSSFAALSGSGRVTQRGSTGAFSAMGSLERPALRRRPGAAPRPRAAPRPFTSYVSRSTSGRDARHALAASSSALSAGRSASSRVAVGSSRCGGRRSPPAHGGHGRPAASALQVEGVRWRAVRRVPRRRVLGARRPAQDPHERYGLGRAHRSAGLALPVSSARTSGAPRREA